ncbi:MAG: UDP-N-acetylglucosamine 1-carboxyvinyltransferase [Jiangellales bacterium]
MAADAIPERLRVHGGSRLDGAVRIAGAKNSALKLMAAALLAPGRSVLHDVPDILDVEYMAAMLENLGCSIERYGRSVAITVPSDDGLTHRAPYGLVRRLRASIAVLGPLVGRLGAAEVALPGGDNIGSRGLDMHLAGLERLGASIGVEHGNVVARAPGGLQGRSVWLDFPSVGATENLLMAGVLAQGTTVIDNAAREPEIVDLCQMLAAMGAEIDGAGSSTVVVRGVAGLHPVEHVVVPDRIVTGTWAVAAVMTQGDVTITNARPEHLEIVLDKLSWAGARLNTVPDGMRVRMDRRPRAFDVVTLPYPGFPTDLQPMVVALNSIADGTSMITENVFESRFMFVNELARLGADVRTEGHHAAVRGKGSLSGAPVAATDIRAGAGLVLAGLVAEGETLVTSVHHIDRGYPDFVPQLCALGATVTREADEQDAYA